MSIKTKDGKVFDLEHTMKEIQDTTFCDDFRCNFAIVLGCNSSEYTIIMNILKLCDFATWLNSGDARIIMSMKRLIYAEDYGEHFDMEQLMWSTKTGYVHDVYFMRIVTNEEGVPEAKPSAKMREDGTICVM